MSVLSERLRKSIIETNREMTSLASMISRNRVPKDQKLLSMELRLLQRMEQQIAILDDRLARLEEYE